MIFQWSIPRKKTLRKLTKSFTENYNFKRLLQTAPDLVRLYNKQESAVNGVKPVRFIQIKEDMGPIEACNMHDPAESVPFEVFGPASPTDWPMRIKYAEQIHDLTAHGFRCVWTVRLVESHNTQWTGHVSADVKQVPNPQVVTFWPNELGKLIPPTNAHRRVDPEHLPTIDERSKASFFLSDGVQESTPQELTHCGIIPHERHLWNATFYDYEVAYLYAESVQHQIRHTTSSDPRI